ncbi:FAD binding domain-containing protein [Georgenia satyanarayanai]|uniref:FAD binding domain-containing protein n=1 Tax=Georgenia satyanarayanai TaxID=860221 RepID=UPI00203D09C1|nr:FAD binding domain-containing protein [Georgenia satyanarayanai]MCM3660626.1 FAD binding domain-containing protein [Georgenia satyanarayanai]
MNFFQPTTWDEALQARAQTPGLLPIAGGTDLMVEFNFDHRRPAPLMDMTRLEDAGRWWREGERIRLGAAVPYTRVLSELGRDLPGLAIASRTVGSPQIRNRGTVGGNLGAASPAGDSAPTLIATRAEVEIRGVDGTRHVPVADFFTGVKRNCVASDELIVAIWVPTDTGPQQYSKIGTRNAMVISVASVALTLHPRAGRVGIGMGSVGPTPLQAVAAEEFLAGTLDEGGYWHSRAELPESLVAEFGRQVAGCTAPIDDVRSTAGYRRSAVGVMARRTLSWAWSEYRHGDRRPTGCRAGRDGEGMTTCE